MDSKSSTSMNLQVEADTILQSKVTGIIGTHRILDYPGETAIVFLTYNPNNGAEFAPDSQLEEAIARSGFKVRSSESILIEELTHPRLEALLDSGAALVLPSCFFSFGVNESDGRACTMGVSNCSLYFKSQVLDSEGAPEDCIVLRTLRLIDGLAFVMIMLARYHMIFQ